MEGDSEFNFIHFAIQKLHWSPSKIEEWLNSSEEMKAIYFASVLIRADAEKKKQKEIENKVKKK